MKYLVSNRLQLANEGGRCTYGKTAVRWHGEAGGRTGAQVADLVFVQTRRRESLMAVEAKWPCERSHASIREQWCSRIIFQHSLVSNE